MKSIVCPRCNSKRVLENNPLDNGDWTGVKGYTCVDCTASFLVVVNSDPIEKPRSLPGCRDGKCLI